MLARRLYKELLRYGQNLKYTNKNYYYRRIRAEFENNRFLSEKEDIQFHIEKGNYFLEKKLLV